MSRMGQSALDYASRGWHVVPLYGLRPDGKTCACRKGKKCSSQGKHPILVDWPNQTSCDEDKVAEWIEQFTGCNWGVKLGEQSGIIDIECDDSDAEKHVVDLFDGKMPICPTFQSSKGRHRIFKWSANLPGLAVFRVGKVEIRTGNGGKGAQSVFPPSPHADNGPREWLPGLSPDEVDPPELPASVVAKLWNLSGEDSPSDTNGNGHAAKGDKHWQQILKGVPEGSRNETAASLAGHTLASIDPFHETAVSTQWTLLKTWNESKNHPPLPEDELRTVFESILSRERTRRLNDGDLGRCDGDRKRDPSTGEANQNLWRLVILDSEPPVFALYSPRWQGALRLTASQFRSPQQIGIVAVEQKFDWLQPWFVKAWNGDKNDEGMASRLLKAAVHEPAPIETRRSAVVAELFAQFINKHARTLEEGSEPDSKGRPCLLADGRLVFSFTYVWEPLKRSEDKVLRGELSDVLKEAGATDELFQSGDGRARLKVLDKAAQRNLRIMLAGREPAEAQA